MTLSLSNNIENEWNINSVSQKLCLHFFLEMTLSEYSFLLLTTKLQLPLCIEKIFLGPNVAQNNPFATNMIIFWKNDTSAIYLLSTFTV